MPRMVLEPAELILFICGAFNDTISKRLMLEWLLSVMN
jgi:hypothetical protein